MGWMDIRHVVVLVWARCRPVCRRRSWRWSRTADGVSLPGVRAAARIARRVRVRLSPHRPEPRPSANWGVEFGRIRNAPPRRGRQRGAGRRLRHRERARQPLQGAVVRSHHHELIRFRCRPSRHRSVPGRPHELEFSRAEQPLTSRTWGSGPRLAREPSPRELHTRTIGEERFVSTTPVRESARCLSPRPRRGRTRTRASASILARQPPPGRSPRRAPRGRRPGPVRRRRRGRRARGGGRVVARQAGRGVPPERHDGPAGGAADPRRRPWPAGRAVPPHLPPRSL